jgi:DNA-binding MarR family transcriptional regulator
MNQTGAARLRAWPGHPGHPSPAPAQLRAASATRTRPSRPPSRSAPQPGGGVHRLIDLPGSESWTTARGRLHPYELSRIAGWEKSRLHHRLTRMCTRGLITRERCGSRGMHAVITAKGLAALKEAVPGYTQEVRRLFIDRLTPEQIEQLAGIATTILDNLLADQPPLYTSCPPAGTFCLCVRARWQPHRIVQRGDAAALGTGRQPVWT